jgi:hypothetical protein
MKMPGRIAHTRVGAVSDRDPRLGVGAVSRPRSNSNLSPTDSAPTARLMPACGSCIRPRSRFWFRSGIQSRNDRNRRQIRLPKGNVIPGSLLRHPGPFIAVIPGLTRDPGLFSDWRRTRGLPDLALLNGVQHRLVQDDSKVVTPETTRHPHPAVIPETTRHSDPAVIPETTRVAWRYPESVGSYPAPQPGSWNEFRVKPGMTVRNANA